MKSMKCEKFNKHCLYVAKGKTKYEIKRNMMVHIVKMHKEVLRYADETEKTSIAKRLNLRVRNLQLA